MGVFFLMKRYVVRVESEAVPDSRTFFCPVTLEFPEPLSFQELSRLKSLLQDREPERFDQRLSHALSRMRDEFSLQGQVLDFAVSAKILV